MSLKVTNVTILLYRPTGVEIIQGKNNGIFIKKEEEKKSPTNAVIRY